MYHIVICGKCPGLEGKRPNSYKDVKSSHLSHLFSPLSCEVMVLIPPPLDGYPLPSLISPHLPRALDRLTCSSVLLGRLVSSGKSAPRASAGR